MNGVLLGTGWGEKEGESERDKLQGRRKRKRSKPSAGFFLQIYLRGDQDPNNHESCLPHKR